MPYIRLSIACPKKGQEARLEEIFRRLCEIAEQIGGCKEHFIMRPHDSSGDLARIAVYEDEAAAEAVANHPSVMALRSEMHLITEPGHTERAFFTI